jgi:hypothetical protein
MLILDAAAKDIDLVTDAAGDIEVQVSYMDHNAGTFTPAGVGIASITTATTTEILSGPAAGQRNVKHINIRNNHASQAVLVTVRFEDTGAAVVVDLFKCTLLAGESLVFTQGGVWLHYDVNGGTYPQVGAIATQAEMEAGTSLVTTVSPGRQHFHPSAAKFWSIDSVSATVANYNLTSITDNGVGLHTYTIATDFSSVNWAAMCSVCNLDATIDAAADGFLAMFANASQTAGAIQMITKAEAGTAAADGQFFYVVGFGDQ